MTDHIRIFQANELIFREGVYERCMYDILEGSVSIFVNYGKKDEKLLTILAAGQFFGEIGIAEALPRTATAVAAEANTRLKEITVDNFDDYFRQDPEKLMKILRQMSGRLRDLTGDYLEAQQTIREAVEAARKGASRSEGLTAKIAALVQNAKAPAFLRGKRFDEAAFLHAQAEQQYMEKVFRKNEIIFREGDVSGCLYDIRWGSVGIYTHYGTPDQKLLVKLRPEAFFGEMGMLENLPRSGTAVALESDTTVQVISADMFHRYLTEKPLKVLAIMMHLSSRIRALTKDYMEACRMVEEAIAAERDAAESNTKWTDIRVEAFQDALNTPSDPWTFYNRYY